MSAHSPIRIATRGSALALAQANTVLAQARAVLPDRSFDLRIIKTTGDKLQTASLASSALPKGLFTKEIEEALLRGEAELAVHSLKDLPTQLPGGLKLGAVLRRADVRDVLVYREEGQASGRGFRPGARLHDLPQGATVASSSTRRRAQLLELRPDLNIVSIRGNVGTRLKKLAEQAELDATVLAAAGLLRLHFRTEGEFELRGEGVPQGLLVTPLDPDVMLPCVGQAAIGIEVRENDAAANAVCAALNDAPTLDCVLAERAFLTGMGGGCQLAVAAYATLESGQIWLRAVSYLAEKPRRGELRGPAAQAAALGQELADQLLQG